MEAKQSPFIRKTVKCPACHYPYEQRYFRKGLFAALNEEPDHFVPEFQWLQNKVEQVHPPYYFVCFCPRCFYADTIEDFSDPWRTDFGPYVIKYFRRILKSGDSIKDALGRRVHYEQIESQSALHLHLLALYTQLLPPPDLHDAYKIARLYLRVAWLYRETPLGESSARPSAPAPVSPPAQGLASGAARLLERLERVDKTLGGLTADLPELAAQVEQALGPAPGKERALGPLSQHLTALVSDAARTVATMRQLAESELSIQPAAPEEEPLEADEELPGPVEPPPEPMEAAGHRDWLEQVQSEWPPLPLSETEASRTAIRWFQKAIEQDSRLDSHESFASVAMIMAHLHTRLEDLEAALDTVNGIHRSALETRMKGMERLRGEAHLSEADKKRIDARLTRLAINIDNLVDAREDLISRLIERDRARIREVLMATKGRPIKAREEALSAAGIRNEVITRLKRKGGPLAAAK